MRFCGTVSRKVHEKIYMPPIPFNAVGSRWGTVQPCQKPLSEAIAGKADCNRIFNVAATKAPIHALVPGRGMVTKLQILQKPYLCTTALEKHWLSFRSFAIVHLPFRYRIRSSPHKATQPSMQPCAFRSASGIEQCRPGIAAFRISSKKPSRMQGMSGHKKEKG